MRCNIRNLALTAVMLLTVPFHTTAQEPARRTDRDAARFDAPVLTTDASLHASLQRIFRGSASWREALAAVRPTGRRVLVVRPSDPIVNTPNAGTDRDRFDSAGLAEVVPAVDHNSQVRFILVIVNVPLIQRLHDARTSTPRDLEADLDRILVHEIYGHAIPYLLVGSLAGRCADPQDGERPADACSIKRENVVRSELGLGRRTDGGLQSLSLARGGAF